MSDLISEFYLAFEWLWDKVTSFITVILENDFLRLYFVVSFVLGALSLVLFFFVDFNNLSGDFSFSMANKYARENRQLQREIEREMKAEQRHKENLAERERLYLQRRAEHKQERAEDWARSHPNANGLGEQYANAYFVEHPQAVSFSYDGVTYYNNYYLDQIANKLYTPQGIMKKYSNRVAQTYEEYLEFYLADFVIRNKREPNNDEFVSIDKMAHNMSDR